MEIISFETRDVDEIQELVTRPLGDVDAWDIHYYQTERGVFTGSYVGAALPSDRSPFITGGEAIRNSTAGLHEALSRKPAVFASHQTYGRRLHITGRAPKTFIAFIVPLGANTAIHYKGQTVGPEQFIAVAPGEEVDFVTKSNTDFLSVRLDPENAQAMLSALGRAGDQPVSGVFTPAKPALRAVKGHFSRWFEPAAGTGPYGLAALKALELDILASLTVALDAGFVAPVSPGLRHRQVIAGLARDYLEANLNRPVAITELCAVTGATLRTLHYAFKCCFGTSPAAYHKYRRLQIARDNLRRFQATEVSVTEIAVTNGFWHFGRFAVDYKTLFGETPSQTLAGYG